MVLCTVSTCLCGYGPDYGYESVPGKRPEGSPALPGRVVQAALHTKHTIRFVNVDIPTEDREPQIIEVGAGCQGWNNTLTTDLTDWFFTFKAPLPIIMHFKSASSRIRVQQSHSGSGPSHVQETKSEDSPTHLRHEGIFLNRRELIFHCAFLFFCCYILVTKPIIQEVRVENIAIACWFYLICLTIDSRFERLSPRTE